MPTRLLVVDGSYALHRSYHATAKANLRTADGRPVGALHGALTSICKLGAKLKPTHLVVALDVPGGCGFRQELLEGYKQGRTTPHEDLAAQLTRFPLLLAEAGIGNCAVAGWEADDVIASLVTHCRSGGGESLVWTTDRDAYQLLEGRVAIVDPKGTKFTAEDVTGKYGVTPAQYRELAALRGETADNIPGVVDIGDKTAAKILSTIGSLTEFPAEDELVAKVGAATAKKLVAGRDVFERNLAVNKLRTNLDIVDAFEAGALPLDRGRAQKALSAAGLKTLAVSVPATFGD